MEVDLTWRVGGVATASRASSAHTRDQDAHNARRVHAQTWRSQVTWLVSEANAYTDLTTHSTFT